MKLHLDNVNPSARTGPNTFASRLTKGLLSAGHDVVAVGSDADASIVFIEPTGAPLAKRVVQRLDGIWFKPEEFQTKNVGIKGLYDRADGVIFQSRFDQQMVTKWWGEAKAADVIHNGVDTTPINEITIPQLVQIRSMYEHVFVCSSNWHPQKRLKSNIELFDHLRRGLPNSCLLVMGNNPDCRVTDPHVMYTGSQPPEVYMQVLAAANWMLHLAWLDHCPNVVVEALAQGTPVLCSESGGTKELVGDFGVILRERQSYDFSLVDYDNPPSIDVEQVLRLPNKDALGSHADIDIVSTTQRYIKFIEELS